MNTKMKFLWMLSIILLLNWNCRNPDDGHPKDSRILWEEEFIETQTAVNNIDPIIAENKVFIFRDILDYKYKETAFMAFDKQTGEKKWTWREVKKMTADGNEIPYVFYKVWYYEGVLIGLAGRDLFGISAETGEKIWHIEFDDEVDAEDAVFEGKLYFVGDNYFTNHRLIAYGVDPVTGNYKSLFDLAPFYDGYEIRVYGNTPYKNGQGEMCLLLGLSHKNENSAEDIKYNLFSFNIADNEVEFDVELPNAAGLAQFTVSGDKIYGAGKYVSKYDLRTGELLKQFTQDESTPPVNIFFDYPDLYIMYNNITNKLIKIDLSSMMEIWRTSLDGHQGRKIKLNSAKLYLGGADGIIYIVDAQSGSILERLHGPYESEDWQLFFDYTFNFDEETDYFYCSDFKHLFCYNFEK